MNRRSFLIRSAWLSVGGVLLASCPTLAKTAAESSSLTFDADLYRAFKTPDSKYRPFVRWWWNGDKIKAEEIIRELRLLKSAGIGGVEINPVMFPGNTDDLGVESLQWLSDEWIAMLQVAFDEAKRLDMTCDLIVGSGWPFGAEYLEGEERGQVMVIGVTKLEGAQSYRTSKQALLINADPLIAHASHAREPHLISLTLVPDPMSDFSQVIDLSAQCDSEMIEVEVPEGKHALYALVRIDSFAGVICGAPGATGPTLNHLNKEAVAGYLNRMSDAIEAKTGALSGHIRSLFTDSMELEGANWAPDMAEEFERRNGYDIMPYLPYTMFLTGKMGNVRNYHYGADFTPEFQDTIERIRYDFERTKADLFRERFSRTYTQWCRELGVRSRAQAYGRGFYPLESSMEYDIPEGESWTTNYLQHRLGEEMGNEDYRRGRAYTMVNKFVSSGAHLTGKRTVSCEEMTNTYRAFNATPEFLKLGSDMSIISGITHSIYHGFNYSPPEAEFPGWVRFGTYHSERNNFWRYFNCLNDYKARVSSLLTNADMFADIAILPPVADMWSTMGVQNEPFPSHTNVPYSTLVWEALHKNGNATDYLSEEVIQRMGTAGGRLTFGKRSYHTLFMIEVERTNPETLAKVYDFVAAGGRLFCIEKMPDRSLGWVDHAERDEQVSHWIEKLKEFPDRFILLPKPTDNDFMAWYPAIQERYGITPYVSISNPSPYLMQVRYTSDSGSEILFINNAHLHEAHQTRITLSEELLRRKNAWVWDAETGERYALSLEDGGFDLDLSAAGSLLVVLDKERNKKAPIWAPLPPQGENTLELSDWSLTLNHSLEGWTKTVELERLQDLKETDYATFTGTATYRTTIHLNEPAQELILNLGRVFGVAEVRINGQACGVRWYGRRLYNVGALLIAGENTIEVDVTTSLGNYMQTMTDNKIAQAWTNRPKRPQPVQSMGLAGPVTLYTKN